MQRTFDHELTLTLKPKNNSNELFFNHSEKILKEIEDHIEEKYKDQILLTKFEKTGIEYFTQKIEDNENFTFVKYGDGELLCMLGAKGENCDFHPYSERLSKLLQISFATLLSKSQIFLADWKDNLIDARDSYISMYNLKPKFADYDCFLSIEDNMKTDKLLNFYSLIKNSSRKKIFIGPEKLSGVIEMLEMDQHIKVPFVNAFSEYDQIKQQLVQTIEDDAIYIYCCSMMSCVLINDLVNLNSNITNLDVGSGFDAIFSDKSRPKQPSKEKAHSYYRSILPENLFRKKIDIAKSILSKRTGSY